MIYTAAKKTMCMKDVENFTDDVMEIHEKLAKNTKNERKKQQI